MSTPTFTGFPDSTMGFFRALAKQQDRDWFKARKADYERDWAQPMALLLAEVREALAPTYAPLQLGKTKVFRIQRDVRFSKDKSPYKTSIGGYVPIVGVGSEDGSPTAALYLQVGLECFAAAGMWMMAPDTLARYRDAVDDEHSGKVLTKQLAALARKGFSPTSGEELKTAPRGFDPAHPRVELLRRKGLAVHFPIMPKAALSSRELERWLVASAKTASPLVRWLVEVARR